MPNNYSYRLFSFYSGSYSTSCHITAIATAAHTGLYFDRSIALLKLVPQAVAWAAAELDTPRTRGDTMLHKDLLERLSIARSLLEEVPDQQSVPAVATSIGMSEYHFIRLFASVFGETPRQYAIRSRLATAKNLLASTSATISDITEILGYQSVGTFSTLFKDRLGLTPSQYRSMAIARRRTKKVPAHLLNGCVSLMCGIEHSSIQ